MVQIVWRLIAGNVRCLKDRLCKQVKDGNCFFNNKSVSSYLLLIFVLVKCLFGCLDSALRGECRFS